MESWSAFPKGERGRALYAEVRIAMIQGFSSPGCAIDMLIQFRESCFQISLVKIPSYNEFSLRIWGFQFTLSLFRAIDVSAWGGIYVAVIMIEENFMSS